MAEGDRPGSIRAYEARSAVAASGDPSAIGRTVSWGRLAQINQAWHAFLFDVAQITRDTVVFVGLAGGLIVVFLALMGGS